MAEQSTRSEDLVKGNENKMLRFARNGFVAGDDDGKFIFDMKLCRDCDCVEVEAMAGSKFGALDLFQRCKGR